MEADKVRDVVSRALEHVNAMRIGSAPVGKTAETILVGRGAELDSVAFVHFIAALEEEGGSTFGMGLNLASVIADSDTNSPITLGDFVARVAALTGASDSPA